MNSTGNDIVALKSLNKQRTCQVRFYSKILSVSEQGLYHQPQFEEMPFEIYVWLSWSVKESAYKYLKRILPDLIFSPTKIVIRDIKFPTGPLINKLEYNQWGNSGYDQDFYSGTVLYGSHLLYFRTKISNDWIATVVNDDENFNQVCWGIQSIEFTGYSSQSQAVRTLLLKRLNFFFPGNLQIEKSLIGYPVILKDTQDLNILVSLAHDDQFVAYSFKLDQKG